MLAKLRVYKRGIDDIPPKLLVSHFIRRPNEIDQYKLRYKLKWPSTKLAFTLQKLEVR